MRRYSHLLIDLSIAIQHHPNRADLLPPLLAAIGRAEVVEDPDPEGERSPLRTYVEALRRTPAWATHRLVIQDDTLPCGDFRTRAIRAVAEHPDRLLCLFSPGGAGAGRRQVFDALATGKRFAQIGVRSWVPVVATSWPAALAREFVAYAETQNLEGLRSDDAMVGKFARARRLEVWATVPSLVQHPDVVPSLIGRQHRAGGDRGRVAAVFE